MLFEDSRRFIEIVEYEVEEKFKNFPEEYKSIVSKYCIISVFFRKERSFLNLIKSSENLEDFIRDISRFIKLILDDHNHVIKSISERDRNLDEQRLIFVIENVEKIFKEHSDLL